MNIEFKILIVDDNKEMLTSLNALLERNGYLVDTADHAEMGLEKYKSNKYDLVISDIRMPGMDGIELLKEIKSINQEAIVVLITAYSSVEQAIEAIKYGAEDYLLKPYKSIEIKKIVEKIYNKKVLEQKNEILKQEISRGQFQEIIGESPQIQKVFKDISIVADADVAVLVTGESGTGKELIAKAIHQNSSRKNEPFIPINCAALPNDLLESELFGHEKGAFSGAVNRKYGLFEVADKGTLFLDEIGEMPLALQAKLLRTVETKKIRRIGGTTEIDINIRIVSATNRDLRQEIANEKFREDLFFRLNGYSIQIPALRERLDDIKLLANFILEQNRYPHSLPQEIINAFMNYDWPGNVRELINTVERLILLSRQAPPTLESLPIEFTKSLNTPAIQTTETTKVLPLKEVERRHIISVYNECNQDKVKTAQQLEIGLKTLYRKLEQYKND